jgi:hypothetical protein
MRLVSRSIAVVVVVAGALMAAAGLSVAHGARLIGRMEHRPQLGSRERRQPPLWRRLLQRLDVLGCG